MAIKNIIVIDLQNIGVTNDYWNVPFVVLTIRSFPHSWVTTCVCNKSSTTSVTKEVETDYFFVAVYRGVRFAQSVIYVL